MPYWSDIDNTYLDKAVTRLAQMIELATPLVDDRPVQVVTNVDPDLTPPFWWLYPGVVVLEPQAFEADVQPYEIVGRYVLAYSTGGYEGNEANRLWTLMPTILNYINGHKRLMFTDRTGTEMYPDSVPSLDHNRVRARQASGFGQFPQSVHLGIEIAVLLPFTVQIEQEY